MKRWSRRTRLRLGVSRPETSSGSTNLERGLLDRPLTKRWRPDACTSLNGRAVKVTSGAAAKSVARRVVGVPGGGETQEGIERRKA